MLSPAGIQTVSQVDFEVRGASKVNAYKVISLQAIEQKSVAANTILTLDLGTSHVKTSKREDTFLGHCNLLSLSVRELAALCKATPFVLLMKCAQWLACIIKESFSHPKACLTFQSLDLSSHCAPYQCQTFYREQLS